MRSLYFSGVASPFVPVASSSKNPQFPADAVLSTTSDYTIYDRVHSFLLFRRRPFVYAALEMSSPLFVASFRRQPEHADKRRFRENFTP